MTPRRQLTLLHVASPESKVVSEQLHNEGGVPVCQLAQRPDSLVRLLGEGVELGNGIVKGLLGEVASAVWAVEDLVAGVSASDD